LHNRKNIFTSFFYFYSVIKHLSCSSCQPHQQIDKSAFPNTILTNDEIDTGISGETVRKVAEKLKELSANVQVICVTHSPQIAAKAEQQFFIKKEIENNLTETKVRELNTEERIREIARIISGDNITEASIVHAKEIMGL